MTDEVHTHDVLIIGAGPCGLALAARLCEPYPSALFTDSEHQKFHFLRRSQPSPSSASLKYKPTRTSRRTRTSLDRLSPGPSVPTSQMHGSNLDIAVLDKHSSSWLGVWNTWFDKLSITHLRSPLFFHTDPGDRDALRGFAWRKERMDELKEIRGVVGRELSKWARRKRVKGAKGKQTQEHTFLDERDRNDYFRPSQALFRAHCEEVAARYDLSDVVEKAEVFSVSYDTESGVFTLQTSTGVRKARIVAMAAGAGAPPRLPPDSPFNHIPTHGTVKHVFSSPSPAATILPEPLIQELAAGKMNTSLAVIGSGLTSAQLCSLAVKHGVQTIHLICRDRLKTKHFDVDLCWLAKFKNESMARFWMADSDEEKWEMVRDAKGGGSVNPEFRDVVRSLVRDGRVLLREQNRVWDATWLDEDKKWKLGVESVKCGYQNEASVREEIIVDAVVYATGSAVDFTSIKAVQSLLHTHPMQTVAGLPCLTKELMWNEEVPFFVTGRLGGLRLGPAAGNLEGARIGAELVAGRVLGLLGVGGEERCVDERCIGLGMSNSFDILGSDGEDEEVRAML